MECDDDAASEAVVSDEILPYSSDFSVNMECDDDTASLPVFQEAVGTNEIPQCSDLDTQIDGATETDCNNNSSLLCHVCGILEGCQCTLVPTVVSYSNDLSVNVECTVSLPVFQEAVGMDEIPQCSDLDTQVDADDAPYRSTVRKHKRTGVQLTRKRKRNYSEWKSVQRKKLRQQGKAYIMSTGATAQAKGVKRCKRDHEGCRFKCALRFDEESQQIIHTEHWSLTDDEKRQFYINTTTRQSKGRTRRAENCNKKKMSYAYYFFHLGQKIRVCKEFYLKTLDIDAKRIRNTHNSKNLVTGTPGSYLRGKHTKKSRDSQRASIRRHIESIPTVESHYCRRDTNKTYIDGKLNLQILYEKYVEICESRGEEPAKIHLYRDVFNHEYNIDFVKPKKDRCDICEAEKVRTTSSAEEQQRFAEHMHGKAETHNERNKDRSNCSQCTVCFDMQNVFALPLANVSNFFYKRKLSTYHLTAHCSVSKQSYGALWSETMSGRSGNDIASALVCILDKLVKDHPNDASDITLWSDSCVPQNRNKVMSTALLLFMKNHPAVKIITQKFGEPGHTEIQEIDNVHSQVEKVLNSSEVYSPLGLVRVLSKTPRHKPIKLIQLKKDDMKDYHGEANQFRFDCIPYSKVKAIQYTAEQLVNIKYKLSFTQDWKEMKIEPLRRNKTVELKMPANSTEHQFLSAEKLRDLESMLSFMPAPDREFMQTVMSSCLKCGKRGKGRQHSDSESDVQPDSSDDVHVVQRTASGKSRKVVKKKYPKNKMVAIKKTVKNKNEQSTRKPRITRSQARK